MLKKLNRDISLSKRHQRVLETCPEFFIPALNLFSFLNSKYRYLKPTISCYRDELSISYRRKEESIDIILLHPTQIVIMRKHEDNDEKTTIIDLDPPWKGEQYDNYSNSRLIWDNLKIIRNRIKKEIEESA